MPTRTAPLDSVDPRGYIDLDDRHRCPHGVHKGLGCRVCDPAMRDRGEVEAEEADRVS